MLLIMTMAMIMTTISNGFIALLPEISIS
jgi:hypothetical protein